MDDGRNTPEHFVGEGLHPLWRALCVGDDHRTSSVVAEELQRAMASLVRDYAGSVGRMATESKSWHEISQRLRRLKGIGPKTGEIVLGAIPEDAVGTA